MGIDILVAEPHHVLRAGLRAIFREDERVANIYEATNQAEVTQHLYKHTLYLTIINQSILTDMSILSKSNFVILAAELDMTILRNVYQHGARGYLLEKVSAPLLRTLLRSTERSFLIEPSLMPQLLTMLFNNVNFYTIEEHLLTASEKKIMTLLREGYDKSSIAKQLSITENTLKVYTNNINRKNKLHHDSDATAAVGLRV